MGNSQAYCLEGICFGISHLGNLYCNLIKPFISDTGFLYHCVIAILKLIHYSNFEDTFKNFDNFN